jgi:biopolymer transport protein TolR
MAMSDPGRGGMLAEINVTPLVDVMLVLLIIFMISSSIETLQIQQEKERAEDSIRPPEDLDQKVPVNLPRTDAEPVNMAEDRKLVLSINKDAVFHLGEIEVLRCLDAAPEIKGAVTGDRRRAWGPGDDEALRKCLDPLVAKLGANEKLKADQELYLRADRSLPYGLTLKVMARVRASGVARFGLIADPES